MKGRFFCSVSTLPILLASPAIAAGPAPMATVFSWTGFYAGVNAGGSWGHANSDFAFTGFASTVTSSDSVSPNGAIGGGQFGYNWQLNPNWLIGAEADIQVSGQNDHTTRADSVDFEGITTSYDAKIEWFGTVRGRIGYTFDNRVVLYATGGLAYGRTSMSGTSTTVFRGGTTAFSSADTKTGWAAGGGFEGVAWGPRWTWKVEYLYLDLGTLDAAVASGLTTTRASTRFTDNIVRAGLNFHF